MHTKRIIPCLDVRAGKVVKGINFVGIKEVGDPVELGEYYYKQGADELVFLDITATHEGRGIMEKVVERVSEKIFIPFTVGGGLRNIDDIKRILRAGADKVSLNSAAVRNKELIKEILDKANKAKGLTHREAALLLECEDKELIEKIKSQGIDPCGENGEYHTFVVDGPIFDYKIDIKYDKSKIENNCALSIM